MRTAAVAIAVLASCLSANAQNLILLDEEALARVSERLEAEIIVAVEANEHSGQFLPHPGVFVLTDNAVHFLPSSSRREPIVLPYDKVMTPSMVQQGNTRAFALAIATNEGIYLFVLPQESLGGIMAELRVRMAQ